MAGIWNGTRGFLCLTLALGGCGREPIETTSACELLSPGDLVIMEVHPNPDGSDGDAEYIELFNTRGDRVALDGLTLVTSRADGGSAKAHRFFAAAIEAGDYFVVGNPPLESMPAHVDYSYADALGSLRNSAGLISIRCGEMLIDEVSYESSTDGRALQLDGRLVPDHETNDEAQHWCATPDGTSEAFLGNFGSPGTANHLCEELRAEGACREGGTSRAIEHPAPGDLRITEWMANPDGVDTELEWVELLFNADVDLNGLQLGPAPDALELAVDQDACFPVDAGERVVFGASPTAAPRVDAELRFSLGNSGARSIVAGLGSALLDRVEYDGTTEGFSWQLDPDGELCLASTDGEYANSNFGTPGRANPSCPAVLSPGQCFDDGVPREIVSPRPGEARIAEWMANPSAVGNRAGEWVEVELDESVDLNGLLLSDLTSSANPLEDPTCLRVFPGERWVFARNTSPLENGGIEAVDAELSVSLNNSDETISLSVDGQALDAVSYERSTPGVATQVDDFGHTCNATEVYGDGDLGTPGLANPPCP